MKNILLLFILLIPAFLFAQYPATGNKQRLGYQTTGDGLIWRGVATDTAIKPRTINNAYFQLDTVNRVLRRYIATQGNWQIIGGAGGSTIDSLIYATRYWTNSNFFPLQGGTLTGTAGAGFMGFLAQSSNPGTPTSGFRTYANGAHNLAILDRNGWITTFDISATSNRFFTYPPVGGTFVMGTGAATTNRIPVFTDANTISNSNIQDNNTAISILNSKPFALGQWTTAGRPTGVQFYQGANTNTGFWEGHTGSAWENFITSTGASANQVPYYLSAGRIGSNGGFTYNPSTNQLGVTSSNSSNLLLANFQNTASTLSYIQIANATSNLLRFEFPGAASWDLNTTPSLFSVNHNGVTKMSVSSSGAATIQTSLAVPAITGLQSLTISKTDNGAFYLPLILQNLGTAPMTLYMSGKSPKVQFDESGSHNWQIGTTGVVNSDFRFIYNTGVNSDSKFRITSAYKVAIGGTSAPARDLDVTGELRVSDLTTDTPTRILGADADGDFGAVALASNLSITSGVLSAQNIYNANGIATGNRAYDGGAFTLDFNNVSRLGINSNRFNFSRNNFYSKNVDTVGVNYWGTSPYWGTSFPGQNGFWFRDSVPVTSEGQLYVINGKYGDNTHLFGADFYGGASGSVSTNYWITKSKETVNRVTNRGLISWSYKSSNGASRIQHQDYASMKGFYGRGDTSVTMQKLHFVRGDTAAAGVNNTYYQEFSTVASKGSWKSGVYWIAEPKGILGFASPSGESGNRWGLLKSNAGSDFWLAYTPFEAGRLDESTNYAIYGNTVWVNATRARLLNYGASNKRADALGVTASNFAAGLSTNGTIYELEVRRDTTIYVTDADYNLGSALSNAEINRRYKLILIASKLTAGATSDNQIFLPSAASDHLQCTIEVYSEDASADADETSVDFTSNGAANGTGGTVSAQSLTPGQTMYIRAVNLSGFKWKFAKSL